MNGWTKRVALMRAQRTKTMLVNSCAVSAIATITDPKQGEQRAWLGVTQTIPCARLSKSAAIRAGFYPDDASGAVDSVISVPCDAAIQPGDHIEIDGDGVTWSVEGNIDQCSTHEFGIFLTVARVAS